MEKQGIIISPEEYERIEFQLKELNDIKEHAISVEVRTFGIKWLFFANKDELNKFILKQANDFQNKITDAENIRIGMESNGYVSLDIVVKNMDLLCKIKSKLERINSIPWWKSKSGAINSITHEIENGITQNNNELKKSSYYAKPIFKAHD